VLRHVQPAGLEPDAPVTEIVVRGELDAVQRAELDAVQREPVVVASGDLPTDGGAATAADADGELTLFVLS
jgi:hypothetical protein